MQLNVEHIHDGDVVANMTRSPRVKYITYFEDSANLPGKKTAVWELDKGIRFCTILNYVKNPRMSFGVSCFLTFMKNRGKDSSVSQYKEGVK